MAPALKSLELSEGFSKAFLKAGLEKKKKAGVGVGSGAKVSQYLISLCMVV